MEDRHLNLYDLRKLAQSGKEADRLLKQRESYFESLYDDIRYGYIPFGDFLTEERALTADTASQAIEIAENKAVYDKRIIKAQERYRRWRTMLQQLPAGEARIMEGYFERGEQIEDDEANQLAIRLAEQYGVELEDVENKKEKDSLEVLKQINAKEKKNTKTLQIRQTNNELYLIRGEFVEMTVGEYQAYNQQQGEVGVI